MSKSVSALVIVDRDTTPNEIVVSNDSFMAPISGRLNITSRYGYRDLSDLGYSSESFHKGVDVSCASRTELFAMNDGVVTIRIDPFGGRMLTVTGAEYTSVLGHVHAVKVKENTRVSKGDLIGLSGGDPDKDDTPGVSTGAHLHIETYVDGVLVDPETMPFLSGASMTDQVARSRLTPLSEPSATQLDDIRPKSKNVLLTALGITGAALATALVVGLLTEAVQSFCVRSAASEATPQFLKPMLRALGRVPGLKHIDWNNCCIYADFVSRKELFDLLKRHDYLDHQYVFGSFDRNGINPLSKVHITDVDFTDVIRIKLSTNDTLYCSKVERSSYREGIGDDLPLILKGYNQNGFPRFIAATPLVNLLA